MQRADRGASPERTRLAWRRTSLVATVVAVLLVRSGLQHKNAVITAIAALCWVVLLAAIQRRVHALAEPSTLHSTRLLVVTAALCAAFGILGVVLVLM